MSATTLDLALRRDRLRWRWTDCRNCRTTNPTPWLVCGWCGKVSLAKQPRIPID